MRWSNLHILGVGAALGELVPLTEREPDALLTRQRSVSIATGASGVDLAVRAGRAALASTAMTTQGPLPVPGLHFHSAIWRGSRGIDFWSRASYVRTRLGLPAGPGISTELNAMSNSLIGGIDLSARILHSSPDISTILLTGGETFGAPAFDHLTTDRGIVYGDGGSALVLGRHAGIARVLAISSWTDPTLEGLHRGGARFLPPGTTEVGIEKVRTRKAHYIDAVGADSILRRTNTGISEVMTSALAEAELELDDLAWVLPPFYGHHLLQTQCLQPLGLSEERTLKDAGDQWGHLGPNDQIVGMTHLLAHRAVSPGDHLALLGIGIGMTWTCVIVQINQVPAEMAHLAPPLRWPWHPPHTNAGSPRSQRNYQEMP